MIRINLLSEGRRPVVARKTAPSLSLGGQDPNNLILVAAAIVGILVAGVWWYRLNAELNEAQARVKAAQAEYEKLREIIKEVEEYKLKKENLENKVAVIKDLKRKQRGPVNIMDRISRALPDLVWLTSMNVDGATVKLQGQAFNTNAVASFIEALDKVPEFKEPDAKAIRRQSMGGDTVVYSFQIDFGYVDQPAPEEEEAEEPVEGP
jgi:type IV pilus assembly protein PilN